MLLLLIILLPINILTLWLYFHFSPRSARRNLLLFYNIGTFVAILSLCVMVGFKIHGNVAGSPDQAWGPILSGLSALVIFPTGLVIAGLIRNFIVSRTPDDKKTTEESDQDA